MDANTTVRPLSLKKEGENKLTIEWSDGVRCVYPWQLLRDSCPCASCRGEGDKPIDPFHILKPSELAPLKLVSMTPLGHYAYKIVWSDGHDTGLFTLEYLRSLCERKESGDRNQ